MFNREKMYEKTEYQKKTIQQQDDSINQQAKNSKAVKLLTEV